ncbi:MAG: RNA methyltransferase [Opitutaceae bacterium]
MLSKASVQKLRGYSRKKLRVAEGRCLVEGWRSLEAALDAGIAIEWLLETGGRTIEADRVGLLERLRERAVRVEVASSAQMRQITHSVTPPELAGLVSWSPRGPVELGTGITTGAVSCGVSGPLVVVVADGVGDPGNLGTLIRTADWFGAAGFFAGPGSVELTNPKVVQATMGSLFQLPVGTGDSTVDFIEALRVDGFSVASLELGGATDVRSINWPDKLVLVVGNEARGVSPEVRARADFRAMIPRFGHAESLNAAASVAVVLGQIRLGGRSG